MENNVCYKCNYIPDRIFTFTCCMPYLGYKPVSILQRIDKIF